MAPAPGQHGRPDRTLTLDGAMRRALELAGLGPAHGPNPQVGCVLLGPHASAPSRAATGGAAPTGTLQPPRERFVIPSDATDGRVSEGVAEHPREVLAEGYHRGAGTPHAEAAALAVARREGRDVRGAIAVVTLEPCRHTGRTPPCAVALADAGIAEVHYAVEDPDPRAGGGGVLLRGRGVRVSAGLRAAEAGAALVPWLTAITRGRPYVTLKIASSLDGKVAAADGTSRWITGPAAREHAHARRAQVDALAVGTGTALSDDPALTARAAGGGVCSDHQPLRVVVGRRDLPSRARLRGPGGELVHLRTRDVRAVLEHLAGREVRHLLVEGGPRLSSAFLSAGLVDEVNLYLAPLFLGAGTGAVADLGLTTLTDAIRGHTTSVRQLGQDVLIVARTDTNSVPTPINPQED